MAIISEAIKLLGRTGKENRDQQYFYGLVEKNVLVTGAHGQLGNELKELSEKINLPFRFHFTDSDILDITDREQIDVFVRNNHIEYIINCAAYTAVDKAETDKEMAFAVNVTGIGNIATVAKKHNVKVIHISTDFVFDGASEIPYKESDNVNPLSVYGETKLEGEKVLQSLATEWVVIRTSWLYSTYGTNFVKSMIRLMTERERLKVVDDEIGTPTYAADLAEMIIHILQYSEEKEWKTGLFHFANKGEVSRFDFAGEIKTLAGIDNCELSPITTKEYGAPAKRPAYSALDVSKISEAFKVEIPEWKEALSRCIVKLKLEQV
ncbi:MAG: dTDP-4-dehydrorhamnose reductase [Fermentimonas sp.]|nr:dTDP-4-dehydrorhamnose reductase [Fermentimonas sp.]